MSGAAWSTRVWPAAARFAAAWPELWAASAGRGAAICAGCDTKARAASGAGGAAFASAPSDSGVAGSAGVASDSASRLAFPVAATVAADGFSHAARTPRLHCGARPVPQNRRQIRKKIPARSATTPGREQLRFIGGPQTGLLGRPHHSAIARSGRQRPHGRLWPLPCRPQKQRRLRKISAAADTGQRFRMLEQLANEMS